MKKLTVMIAAILAFAAFGFTPKYGLDRYEVFLNQELIAKIWVNQPDKERVLQLGKAKPADHLRVKYIHCNNNGAGTGRSISLQDQNGNVLKTWTFANPSGSYAGMPIVVSELQKMEQSHPGDKLVLYYHSKELLKAELLARLNF
ncbi:MAG: hypothetical protein EOO05_14815 [Chitinophagaceae bacterium]|nr:MAG: hypothetical protein EOO05_14815 [Chitinophagaceae bacterium]